MTSNVYPGNPSLPAEVRERVIATFVQTLSLYDEVKLDEVVAGCDLILEMDDRFEPARKLRQKAKDPSAPIDLGELYALRDSPPAAATGPAPPEHGASSETGNSEALVLDAVERMNRGEYQEAIDICNGILSRDPENEEAQRIGQQAYEMLEAAPFVKQYIDEATAAIDRGDREAAATAVAGARSLDPFHPGVSELESRIETMQGTSEPRPSSGGSFDFGGGDSPFSGAFAGESAPESPATPAPPEEATGFSVGGTEEESSPTDFSFSAEPESTSSPDAEESALPPEVPLMGEEVPEATGFGFTLEAADEPEESAPAASPELEPIPGEAHTFDFSTAGVEVGSEDQQKVQGYIAEGDVLFDSGDYQGAIDAWSRVFLIDVTNEEASERIDKAKAKKRESESKFDELLGTGVAAYEAGNYTTARQTFEEVLAQDPDNFRAREYLDKLDDHSAATGAAAAPTGTPAPGTEEDLYGGEPLEDVYEEAQPAAAPARGAARAPSAKPAPKSPAPARKSQRGLLLAVVAIVALAVGGWFAWTTFRGDGTPATDPAITQGKINRAELLAEGGDYAQAIAVLRTVEPGDPMRDRAMEMIANYRQRQAETGGMIGGRPLNEVREELLSHAREAFAAEDYMQARSSFEEAAKLRALDADDRAMYDVATRQVSKLDTATTLFRQGSYRDAIQELENVLEEEPDNLNARQMLVNAHYNLGVLAFREQQLDEAARRFTIVLEQNPGDEMARRSLQVAQQYRNSPKDLLYQIYVKYLPLR
jgi:tetratricopeptide (TPR) repeat protein